MTSAAAVKVDGVWKFYGDYPALRNVNLTAEPGACLAMIGRINRAVRFSIRMLDALDESSIRIAAVPGFPPPPGGVRFT